MDNKKACPRTVSLATVGTPLAVREIARFLSSKISDEQHEEVSGLSLGRQKMIFLRSL